MWRAFFLAIGIYTLLLGLQSLAVERALLHEWVSEGTREIVPEPWVPWMLLSAGAVVVLYTFTLPKRAKE